MKQLCLFFLLAAACSSGGSNGGGPPVATVFYSTDIQPIFTSDCIHCHGGAGGLELDSYANLIAGGVSGPVVNPGSPNTSILIHRLEGTILPTMPADGPPLTGPEIDRVRQWILEGAQDN